MRLTLAAYDGLCPYFGDLHNHCAVSYGHGSLADAFQNARSQLDFVSVTPHAVWPDLPQEPRLAATSAYHRDGFRRAREQWPAYQEMTNAVNEDGRFVSLLSFEWHSLQSGDHNVYFRGSRGEIIPAGTIEEMRQRLRQLARAGVATFLVPHHIGYRQGYRGINWAEFTPEFSPVVEIFSMHGSAESDEAPYPYLHTMGPRDGRSTMRSGLRQGHRFGVVGSTDHHSAHPGSYGHGRLAAWAANLSRDGLWEAIAARRTYALTGDNIELAFSLNGQSMGTVLPPVPERQIEVAAIGGGAIELIEVIANDQTIHRWHGREPSLSPAPQPVKVWLELGWGEIDAEVTWRVDLTVEGGDLLGVEPRLRGQIVVAPHANDDMVHAYSAWRRVDARGVHLTTRTWGNPTVVTPATQGICLEIHGDPSTRIVGRINDLEIRLSLAELLAGSRVGYLGGFLTPAYCFHRAVPRDAYTAHFTVHHQAAGQLAGQRDWYLVRLRQTNGQMAWSSPIWVENAPAP